MNRFCGFDVKDGSFFFFRVEDQTSFDRPFIHVLHPTPPYYPTCLHFDPYFSLVEGTQYTGAMGYRELEVDFLVIGYDTHSPLPLTLQLNNVTINNWELTSTNAKLLLCPGSTGYVVEYMCASINLI